MIFESAKYEGRGGSIFDGKLDNFDSLDETWSQWMDALRAGRAKTYVPDCLIPHDPETGQLMKPNPFDNRYLAAEGDMREGQKNQIMMEQPAIPHESYLASYITALGSVPAGSDQPLLLSVLIQRNWTMRKHRERKKKLLSIPEILLWRQCRKHCQM